MKFKFSRIFKWAAAIVLALLVGKFALYHYSLVTYPYPNEYREGVMLTTTYGLLNGINPFALLNQPQYTNDYGIFYSVVAMPFAKVFGVTLLVHRLVAAFFIFACCGLMFLAMRRLKVPLFLNVWAMAVFYAFMLYPTTPTACANPSPLGTFLFLAGILIPWFFEYSWGSLLVSVIAGILAYYTKPYFILCVPFMAAYLFLFVSRRKGLVYFGVFAALMAASVVVMNRYFDCYFSNCFFIHTNVGHMSWGQMTKQLVHVWKLNWLQFLCALVAAGFLILRDAKNWAWPRVWKTGVVWPKVSGGFPLILFAGLCSLIVFVFFLGKHEQAYLWYFFHLVMPFLLIYAAFLMSQVDLWPFIFLPVLLANLYTISWEFNHKIFDKTNVEWKWVKDQIDHNKVLGTSLFTPLLVEGGQPSYDTGLSEYFKMGGYRDSKLVALFSKGDGRIILRYYAFMKELGDMLARQEFDLAFVTYDYSPMIPDDLSKYYKYVGDVTLPVPQINGSYRITIWARK